MTRDPAHPRTQAERRAATQSVLLDATIDCLIQDGYSGTSTRRIAERAGVTVGAMQHHYDSKTALVTAALEHLAGMIAAEVVIVGLPDGRTDLERGKELLERVWQVHRGPLFAAGIELWVAARTDPDLRASLRATRGGIGGVIEDGAAALFPALADDPAFRAAVVTGLATLRGLALQGFVPGLDPDEAWPETREHLLELLGPFFSDDVNA